MTTKLLGILSVGIALAALLLVMVLMLLGLELILIFGLAYGVYCKSRTCAVIMFLQFFAAAVYKLVTVDVGSFVVFSVAILIFGYFFGQAVRGTFVYHSLVQRKSPAAAP